MKKLLIAVCSLLTISLLGGCSVRELPEDGGVDPTIVHTEIVLLPRCGHDPVRCSGILHPRRRPA